MREAGIRLVPDNPHKHVKVGHQGIVGLTGLWDCSKIFQGIDSMGRREQIMEEIDERFTTETWERA